MKTQKEKELLETLRKWEDLCHEGLADTAYWKIQAMQLRQSLKEVAGLWEDSDQNNGLAQIMARTARSALAKAEGRE